MFDQTSPDQVEQMQLFLATAPTDWDPNHIIRRFVLPNGECISCVFWNDLFYMTGTDIVRCLVFRFQAIGRPVRCVKKFEEGVFSDLRNLKPGTDAKLEEPKSDFLELLYKNNCIRTQKKQKVFFWYSIPHDRLFMDALERDLKREALGIEPTTVLIDSHKGTTLPVTPPSDHLNYHMGDSFGRSFSSPDSELLTPSTTPLVNPAPDFGWYPPHSSLILDVNSSMNTWMSNTLWPAPQNKMDFFEPRDSGDISLGTFNLDFTLSLQNESQSSSSIDQPQGEPQENPTLNNCSSFDDPGETFQELNILNKLLNYPISSMDAEVPHDNRHFDGTDCTLLGDMLPGKGQYNAMRTTTNLLNSFNSSMGYKQHRNRSIFRNATWASPVSSKYQMNKPYTRPPLPARRQSTGEINDHVDGHYLNGSELQHCLDQTRTGERSYGYLIEESRKTYTESSNSNHLATIHGKTDSNENYESEIFRNSERDLMANYQ